MMKLIFIFISSLLASGSYGQMEIFRGNVYAFKNLKLKNITVTAIKAKTSTKTDSVGNFIIKCKSNDKLKFSGKGFEPTSVRLKGENHVSAKMIFKEGMRNEELAAINKHVRKEDLSSSIELYSYLNIYQNRENILFLLFHSPNKKEINKNQEFFVGPIYWRENLNNEYYSFSNINNFK